MAEVKNKVCLIVIDGWGISDKTEGQSLKKSMILCTQQMTIPPADKTNSGRIFQSVLGDCNMQSYFESSVVVFSYFPFALFTILVSFLAAPSSFTKYLFIKFAQVNLRNFASAQISLPLQINVEFLQQHVLAIQLISK